MNKNEILQAWRDGESLDELTAEKRRSLPDNPAALPQVDDDVLQSVTGGCGPLPTSGFCTPCPPKHCY